MGKGLLYSIPLLMKRFPPYLKGNIINIKPPCRAACYHLARQLENQERYTEAVQFYGKAQAYTNATRLCRANELDSELISYAMYR